MMQVRFNRFSNERNFRSPADFARIADKEADKFAELEESRPGDYEAWARQISAHWREAALRAREDGEQGAQSTLRSAPVIPFESAIRRHLMQVVEQQRGTIATEFMAVLLGNRENEPSRNYSAGIIVAWAELSAMLALESKLQRTFHDESLQDTFQDHENRIREALDQDLSDLEQKRSEFEQLFNDASHKFEQLRASEEQAILDRQEQWSKTHEDFVEQLKISTAVKLWAARGRVHRNGYKSARTTTILFGLGGLAASLFWIFGGFAFAAWLFPDSTAQIASYTAGSIATFTLYIWGLRVMVRSMMSQEHLATDASARSALAHTYLALQKTGQATENDRAIILASLFSPVNDGIVKDDGMPVFSPSGVAANILTRG